MKLFLKAKATYKKLHKTPFPLYDNMHCLVVGTIATGNMGFHPGRDFTPNSSEPNSEPEPDPNASQPTDKSQPNDSQATIMLDWPDSPLRHSIMLVSLLWISHDISLIQLFCISQRRMMGQLCLPQCSRKHLHHQPLANIMR